jgi:hypothetical protein
MLRLDNDGSIRLTIKGITIATIDSVAAEELNAMQLVRWENQMRIAHYNRCNGFYSHKNQQEAREAETAELRLRAYPLATIQPLDAFNAYWEQKRDEAIDG